jgi:hypothetical protein
VTSRTLIFARAEVQAAVGLPGLPDRENFNTRS